MSKPVRYEALDVLRGITIAAMILVNTPGSWGYIYPPLAHARWHGCTPTDLVFPFFMFMIGTAMWFSFGQKKDGEPNDKRPWRIARRAFLLFLIGFSLKAFPFIRDYSDIRIMGVLQRIGLAYGIAAYMCLYLNRKTLLVLSPIILFAYWGLLYFGGGADPYGVSYNLVRQIDVLILGEAHLYRVDNIPFDPEGLLSTLPSVVSILAGYFTGWWIRTQPIDGLPRNMALAGVAALAVGWLWGLVFPINKALWTSSYVVYTTGWAWLIFALLIFVIDIKGLRGWTGFFRVFGTNALFAYILSMVYAKFLRMVPIGGKDGYTWLWETAFVPVAGELNGSLLFAITAVLAVWLVVLVLYHRRWYFRL